MLVLSRKVGERLVIDNNITIVVNRISGNRVALAIEAPKSVQIVRGELQEIREAFAEDSIDDAIRPYEVDLADEPVTLAGAVR